jgi:methylthioribose-1-phosphate isomerase
VYVDVTSVSELVHAIRTLTVRGAPAIGVAAAMGLAVVFAREPDATRHHARLQELAALVEASRPTAVNLRWAVQRLLAAVAHMNERELMEALFAEATRIHDEDVAMCLAIGEAGAHLLANGARVLTHCNAGALATAGIGTALAPVYVAHSRALPVRVFADETRPLLQGARLTAWELQRAGIPVTVLPDSAAATLLARGEVDAVFVGADRIAANGDVANKIGTYPLALAARAHGVPFHVCAPWSTVDAATPSGAHIEIEMRAREEIALSGDRDVVPSHVPVFNPAFDVTPRALITHYITDRGIVAPPFD